MDIAAMPGSDRVTETDTYSLLTRLEASVGPVAEMVAASAAKRGEKDLATLATLVSDMAVIVARLTDARDDAMTTAEAAARLRVTPYAVRKLVERGRLTARHEGRELRITRESVEAFAVDRRPRKKKPKNNSRMSCHETTDMYNTPVLSE